MLPTDDLFTKSHSSWWRTYRSLAAGIGPFGEGGSFNYHIQLAAVGTVLRLQMPDFTTRKGRGVFSWGRMDGFR
ncbi:MAG: hypothetical protein U0231_06865 [Nitrospiraceae bacterium]